MKKTILFVTGTLQLLCYVGAYLIQYFTSRKIGMLRWVNHNTNRWAKKADLDSINAIVLVLLVLLALALLFYALDRLQKRSVSTELGFVSLLASVGVCAACVLGWNRKLIASYYLVCILLFLAALLGIAGLALSLRKKER